MKELKKAGGFELGYSFFGPQSVMLQARFLFNKLKYSLRHLCLPKPLKSINSIKINAFNNSSVISFWLTQMFGLIRS